ncbi:MAG: DUF3822 family protein [Flavobacteriaceae bacterium]|nr:DUF3822 family protein [Flavobacteriaceae bacterium]
MTKTKVQKKTINNILKDHFRKALSIQFSLDGFSFCISNITTNEVQHFSCYLFENRKETPELLLNTITSIVKENKNILAQTFEKITVIHQNNLSSLVPSALFNENELATYLDYNIKILQNDFIAFDDLTQLDIKNVYIPYVNINNYFFQLFGEFEYKHHSTVLIDKLILHTKNNTDKQFFVNVNTSTFDIVVIEQSKLLFYNSFTFVTKEDFIYYILFTAEQLKLNPEEFLLYFLGDVTEISEVYQLTYDYIRNVSFLKIENPLFKNDKELHQHSFYTLLP